MSRNQIPRSHEDDHSHQSAAERRDFLMERTGTTLDHVAGFSFDPETTRGNIENFIGAA